MGGAGGSEDVDTSEAELVALLANQVVKEEKRRLKPGLKHRKKINEWSYWMHVVWW